VAAFIALVRWGAADVIEIINPGPLRLGKAFATTESALPTNVGGCAVDFADDRMTSYFFALLAYSRRISDDGQFRSSETFDSQARRNMLHGPIKVGLLVGLFGVSSYAIALSLARAK